MAILSKNLFFLFLISVFLSCNAQETNQKKELPKNKLTLYLENQEESEGSSISVGTPSAGQLKNGKLMPFSGKNFLYFDTTSYLADRAFVHEKVRNCTLNTFAKLDTLSPNRQFGIMECSHKHGGKLLPHRTHQNGLSIDFMVPLIKNNQPFYDLDTIGSSHYWLEFDNQGKWEKDSAVSLDFELIALQILTLQEEAKKEGLTLDKVIFKTELKPLLFATKSGKILEKTGIYFTKSLSQLINSLHDDHFHVDFSLQ